MGGLTENSGPRDDHSTKWHNGFSAGTQRPIYTYITSTQISSCVFSLKKKEGRRRYKHRYLSVCTPCDLQRTRKPLQVLTISPRFCRARRPTPCHHFACQSKLGFDL